MPRSSRQDGYRYFLWENCVLAEFEKFNYDIIHKLQVLLLRSWGSSGYLHIENDVLTVLIFVDFFWFIGNTVNSGYFEPDPPPYFLRQPLFLLKTNPVGNLLFRG